MNALQLPLRRILRNARRLRAARERSAATVTRERGPGLTVYGLAEYQHGDDARRIDWLATLRLDRPVVREYHRDKERVVFVALDVSPSLRTAAQSAYETGRELAATILATALLEGESAGALLFSDRIEAELPPLSGRGQLGRGLRFFAPGTPVGTGTDFSPVIKTLLRLPRRSLVFILSDFAAPVDITRWRALARRHQVRWLAVSRQAQPPPKGWGFIRLQDSERPEATALLPAAALRHGLDPAPPRLPAIPQVRIAAGENPLPALARLLQ